LALYPLSLHDALPISIKAIQDRSMEMASNHAVRVKETIRDMNGSFASLAAIMMIDPRTDFEFLDSLLSELDSKYPNTKTIISLRDRKSTRLNSSHVKI